ncbi:MAG: hypothetical protein Q9P01_02040 [Anaerolineae bacterium]|nr:hypothetical protein [Anaerolineae bacterium]
MVLEVENKNEENNNEDMSFEELLDTYMYEVPERGQILAGVILEAKQDEIILDVGLKRDAVVTRKDLSRLSQEVINGCNRAKRYKPMFCNLIMATAT